MAHYVKLSTPKADAVAGLALLRFAAREVGRPLSVEERRFMESLEYTVEGRDRRAKNTHNVWPKGERRGLDLRRRTA